MNLCSAIVSVAFSGRSLPVIQGIGARDLDRALVQAAN
jgi:hypothetical protein